MGAYANRLSERIETIGSRLCVGLDPRPDLIDGDVSDFLYAVIQETSDLVAAYKPNIAYFEAMGLEGMKLLHEVRKWIPEETALVLDAKRSDIGETQSYYAKACFDVLGADAVTLNPWLGYDSIEPFLDYPGKGVYLLCVTSNPGAAEFALQELGDEYFFERIQAMCARGADRPTDIGLVAGLTNLGEDVLSRIADVPLLIPGLGAQGGDVQSLASGQRQAPLLINVSRGILFKEPDLSFAAKATAWRDRIQEALQS